MQYLILYNLLAVTVVLQAVVLSSFRIFSINVADNVSIFFDPELTAST